METTYSLEILQAVAVAAQGLLISHPEPVYGQRITTYLSGSDDGDADGCEVVFEYSAECTDRVWHLVSIRKSSISPEQRARMRQHMAQSLEERIKHLPPLPTLPLPDWV